MTDLRRLADDDAITLRAAAVVVREPDGRFWMPESEEHAGVASTAAGGVLGALVGALIGPAGLLLGGAAGAVVGSQADAARAEAAHETLAALASGIPPGTTALIAEIDERTPNTVDAALGAAGGTLQRRSAGDIQGALAERDGAPALREPPEGLLTAPDNRVLAHFDGPDAAIQAVEDLVGVGFSSDEIFVLCGPEGASRLDVTGVHHGLRGRAYRILEWAGDERDLLLRSGDHLGAGGLVLTVPVEETTKAEAARILARHGGREITHFGRGHWERLGP